MEINGTVYSGLLGRLVERVFLNIVFYVILFIFGALVLPACMSV